MGLFHLQEGWGTVALVDVVPVVKVDDLDRSIAFYVDVLGFHVSFRWGDPPFYAGLTTDEPHPEVDTHIHLNRSADSPGAGELYVSVDDVDAYYDKVKAAGVEVAVDIRDQPYGMRDFSVRDPAGNFITVGMPIVDGST